MLRNLRSSPQFPDEQQKIHASLKPLFEKFAQVLQCHWLSSPYRSLPYHSSKDPAPVSNFHHQTFRFSLDPHLPFCIPPHAMGETTRLDAPERSVRPRLSPHRDRLVWGRTRRGDEAQQCSSRPGTSGHSSPAGGAQSARGSWRRSEVQLVRRARPEDPAAAGGGFLPRRRRPSPARRSATARHRRGPSGRAPRVPGPTRGRARARQHRASC